MAISVVCPDCDHSFSVRDEFAGKKGKCPKCGGVFRAEPVEEAIGISVSPKGAARPASSRLPSGSSGINGSNGDLGLNRGAPASVVAGPVSKGGGTAAAGKKPRPVAGPQMPLAGWVTIGVLGIAAACGATGLYVANVGAAQQDIKATQESLAKLDGKAEDAKKKLLAQVKSLEGEVASLKKQLDAAEKGTTKPAEKNVANAFEDSIIPGCVKVKAYGSSGELVNSGSGFFADDKFHVVTTYKVLEGATKVGIVLSTRTEYEIEGIVAANPGNNLAILKPKGEMPGAKVLKLADKPTTHRGQTIYSLGNPGKQEFTCARGIITRVIPSSRLAEENQNFFEVDFKPDAAQYTYIEHDARIFPGDYGGPLVNDALEVIGVNLVLATMVMNDRVTVVPTLGGAAAVEHAKKLLETAKDTIVPYPPAPKKTAKPTKPGDKKDEKKDDEKKDEDKKDDEAKEEEKKDDETKDDEPKEEGEAKPAEAFEALVKEIDQFEWKASEDEQYDKLATLGQFLAAEKKEDESAAADKIKEKLAAVSWDDDEAAALNKLAEAKTPKSAEGVFFIGTVVNASELNGKHTVLVKIEGTEVGALVSGIEKDAVSPGSKYVFVGTYEKDGNVNVQVNDGGGNKPIKAVFVEAALAVAPG